MADSGLEALEDRIARLERRLERERAARLAAEAIGESGTRDLHDQKRQLHVLEAIATASNLGGSVDGALAHALKQICDFTQWPLGHVYGVAVRRGRPCARSRGLWYVQGAQDFGAFQRLSESLTFAPGRGLPGRVLAGGEAAWMSDVTQDPNFPRIEMARQCGLHAAFAFPVMVGSEVAAILEFFSESPMAPDGDLLRTMAQVGLQLGRVIERSRAERDIRRRNTRLRRAVREAEAQREAAEAASRAKSAFLAVTSHEIRTPLNAVLGLAEALRRESLTERQRGLVDGVLDSGSMLLRLLNAVLDLSKIEAERGVADLAPFDPRRMAETVVRVWSAKAEELGLRLRLDLSGLPEEGCAVVSDQGKVEQTLVNLVSNAVKFSPPGGEVVVRIAAESAGPGHLRLRGEVSDQGPGIAASERSRIFGAFEQTAAGREAGGAGLGLAICAGHMALLGGGIGADETPAGGSVFWFEFEAETAEAVPAMAETPAEPVIEAGRPMRILAAEDNPANRRVLQVLLDHTQVLVTFAEDGGEAVEAMRSEAFDLVLMDANMPRMDGTAAVRAIRAMPGAASATPIYMLTANVFEEDLRRYREAGADGALRKPIEVARLYQLLEAVAGGAAPELAVLAG